MTENTESSISHDFGVVFTQLLTRLHVNVNPGLLSEQLNAHPVSHFTSATESLKLLLHSLNITGLKGLAVNWPRFDQKALPALVWFDNRWYLACYATQKDSTKSDTGGETIVLEDAKGDQHHFSDDQLKTAKVICLRTFTAESTQYNSAPISAIGLIKEKLFAAKKWLFEIMIATIVINLLAVMTSLYAMQVYDRVVPSFAYATLWALSAGMFIIIGLDWTLKFLRSGILDKFTKFIDIELSQYVYEHLLKVRRDAMPNGLGVVAAQVSALEAVRNFMSSSIVFGIIDMPFALMFIAFIGLIGGKVAYVYLVALLIAIVFGLFIQFKLRKLQQNEIIRSTERQGFLVESIQAGDTIQNLGADWRFASQWRELSEDIGNYSYLNKRITGIVTTSTATLGTLTYVSAIVVGVTQIEEGLMTMGGLIACSILGSRVIAPISQGVQMLTSWQNTKESLGMVSRLLELPTTETEEQHFQTLEKTPAHMSLKEVSYAYGDEPVSRIKIKDLKVKAGDKIVLLGAIGSGKSTLLKMLAGLYQPKEGVIKLGAANLAYLASQEISKYIHYLPQDVSLFKGTLRSNLQLANASSDEKLAEVCESLGINKIAESHPQNIEMPIAEGGKGLSVGQRQLVGVARTVLSSPKIWLLDEPTASLDSESEKRVLQTLAAHIQPHDIVIIATHRTSFLSLANRVIVMNDGAIIMDDTPQALNQKTQQGVSKPVPSPINPEGKKNA